MDLRGGLADYMNHYGDTPTVNNVLVNKEYLLGWPAWHERRYKLRGMVR